MNEKLNECWDYKHFTKHSICLFSLLLAATNSCNAASSTPATFGHAVLSPYAGTQIDGVAINDIFQDSVGNLWISTQNGAYRSDGQILEEFSSHDRSRKKLPSSDIRGVEENSAGDIILASYGSGLQLISHIDLEIFKQTEVQRSSTDYVEEIVLTPSGSLIAKSAAGIYLFDQYLNEHARWEVDALNPDIPSEVTAIESCGEQRTFLTSLGSLYLLNEHTPEIALLFPLETDQGATAVGCGNHDDVWIAFSDGKIKRFSLSARRFTKTLELPAFFSSVVTSVAVAEKNVWVGTDIGLFRINIATGATARFHTKNSSLKSNYISTLYPANEVLWVGTFLGLNAVVDTSFDHFDYANSNLYEDVLTFEEDEKGNMLVGTYAGLYKLNEDTGIHHLLDTAGGRNLPSIPLMALSSSNDGLWIGSWRGGAIFYPEAGNAKSFDTSGLNELAVTGIIDDLDGSTWISSFNDGVYRISGKGELSKYIHRMPITHLIMTEAGSLFAASTGRIYLYSKVEDDFIALEIEVSGVNNTPLILSAALLDNNRLLVGTKDNGLFIAEIVEDRNQKELSLKRFINNGMINYESFEAIEVDSELNIWAALRTGIIKLSSEGEIVDFFGIADGLINTSFGAGVSYTDSNGQIYFGGPKGYVRFRPKEMTVSSSPHNVKINRLTISAKNSLRTIERKYIDELIFDYSNNFLQIHFADYEHLSRNSTFFRYKLTNFDPDWIDNGSRNTATYTNLPPGDYTFLVQGTNSFGAWDENSATLDIRVLPPPWRTPWAYALYTLLGLVLFLIAKRIYDDRSVKQRALAFAAEMMEDADRADDELQEQQEFGEEAIGELLRHHLFNLELVRTASNALDPYHLEDQSGSPSARLSRRIEALELMERCYFNQPDGLYINLNEYTEELITLLLPGASVLPESITTINRVTATHQPAELGSVYALVVFELLDNAFKHAFSPLSAANYVTIDLSIEGDLYLISVEDDGIGLPENLTLSPVASGGLAVVRSLVQSVDGRLEIRRQDGTRITATIPASDLP